MIVTFRAGTEEYAIIRLAGQTCADINPQLLGFKACSASCGRHIRQQRYSDVSTHIHPQHCSYVHEAG